MQNVIASRRRWAGLGIGLVAVVMLVVGALPAAANTTPQTLPFAQNWTNTALITVTDNWSAVPGVIGYRGDALTGATAVDPQTVVADGSGTPVNVLANQTNPNTLTTGGVAEFDTLPNPVVALQGSGTARAPHLVLALNTSGLSNVRIAYNLRDIDGSADNAVQPVALQYRVGGSGTYTNVPAGFVADATTGPSLATLVTAVDLTLPAATWNKPLVEVRIMTTDAVGSDEWVGVDDLSVTAAAGDQAPSVQATSPDNGATDVPVGANLSITFSEPVDVTGSWFSIVCGTSGTHVANVTGGPIVFSLDPTADFAPGEACTVTVVAANVSDQDSDDPPDTMAADYVFGFTTATAGPAPGDIVVSEVYGGGGNAGATLTNDFIELYNRTGSPIGLAGWSVQYASSAGTTWQATPLSGSIPAGGNYLVQEAAGAGGTTPLPTPDATGSIAMSATAGKVVLSSATAALSGICPAGATIIDVVGYGTTANCFEGSGPAPAPSNTTSDLRKGGGATDTNDNAADFTAGTPDPHPSADQAPAVASTIPASGATGVAVDANVAITFSEPVDVTGNWFTIVCATSGAHLATTSGGPVAFTLDPLADFAADELCTVTVFAANVTDQDTADPPDTMAADYVFTFRTAAALVCGGPATRIHDVQGSGLVSPLVGTGVTIEGIVVGSYQAAGEFDGFYLQEPDADADANPATSEGIFVFSAGSGPVVGSGDVVRVRGTVAEFNGLTELNVLTGEQVCGSGASVATTPAALPVASLDDLERFEGMLVRFGQPLTATEVFNLGRFGEVSLSGAGRLYTPTAITTPGAAAIAQEDQNNRSRIVLDDGNNQQDIDPTRYPQGGLSAANTLRVGDTAPGGLTGVFDYRFSTYRLQPVGPISFTHDNPRTPAPAAVGGNLRVASFNVLNFFNGNGLGGGFPTSRGASSQFELDRQKAKEVSALTAMNADIVGLMEMENDAPPNSALEELVAGLNAATGPGTYAFVNTGVIGTDEIRVALIYKPAAVTPVGAFGIIDSATDPRFIDTLNRPSLAQTFRRNANGARLTVVVQHLKSKGSDCNAVGDPDTGDGSGNCNVTRTNAAKALVDWLATDPTGSGDSDYLLIGDFNSYTFEPPIEWFTTHGYTNLVRQFGGLGAYSYVFNGESGYLDHGLASASLAAQATGATDWHINPDEPSVLDYNVEFKTPNHVNTLYDPGPYRSSDHDPVVVGLNLTAPQTITFAPLPDRAYDSGDFTVSATASSGLDVSFAASGTCTVAGTTVHLVSYGSCTITASQAGNADYTAAPDVARTFAVTDPVAPLTTATLAPGIHNGWYASPTLTLTGDDFAGGSGIAHTDYSLDGGPWTVYGGPLSGFSTGNHFVQYRSTDVAGNVEPVQLIAFKADAVLPSANVSRPADGTVWPQGKDVTAAFKCADKESGIDTCTATQSPGPNPLLNGTTPLETSTLGSHTIAVTATDLAGNVRTTTSHYTVVPR